MNKLFLLCCISLGEITGIRIRDVSPSLSTTCPGDSVFHNDTTAEFFSTSRQPDDRNWPVFSIQVPKSESEFYCVASNRKSLDRNTGFLIKWISPILRTFFFKSILFDSELIFLNKYQEIISINSALARSAVPINSNQDTQYALLVPAGTRKALGLATGDPVKFGDFNKDMYQGVITGLVNATNTDWFHN
jgi:uncharacterized membrane protein (UPF0127 family)